MSTPVQEIIAAGSFLVRFDYSSIDAEPKLQASVLPAVALQVRQNSAIIATQYGEAANALASASASNAAMPFFSMRIGKIKNE
jgi:hypothetical protein